MFNLKFREAQIRYCLLCFGIDIVFQLVMKKEPYLYIFAGNFV